MKKFLSMMLLLTAMFLTFSACSKDDDEVTTTYTLVYDAYDGISTTVRLFECNDNGEKIGNKSIKCKTGDSHTLTADPGVSKVKVYVSMESFSGDINKWVQQVFILKKGGDTKITINGDTLMGNNEP